MKELYRFRQFLTEGVIKENIDFPELEDEFEGAMDAMVVEPEVYLQDIINASPEEIVSDDYYEVMNAVEQGVYSEDEAVELAKAWAKEKLSTLSEGVIKENMSLEVDDDYIEISADSGEYSGDLNNDGTVDFSVVYDEFEDGYEEFDDYNWKDVLGPQHAFVQISKKIPTKVEAIADYVMITVDLEDLKKLLK